jgi:hypothetical protein
VTAPLDLNPAFELDRIVNPTACGKYNILCRLCWKWVIEACNIPEGAEMIRIGVVVAGNNETLYFMVNRN